MPLARHVRETLKLALPVMLARAGLVIMIAVGMAMTGWAGADQQAHFTISLAPQVVMLTLGIGLLVGTVILTAQADGAGRPEDCGRIWRLGMINALLLGLVYAGLLWFGEDILLLLGQDPIIAEGGGRTLAMFAPGMPAILLYVATSAFLEGIRRPRPGMVVSLGANLVNAGLSWVFIFGHLGAEAMGAAGASLATSLTRWCMFLALAGYALCMRDGGRYGVRAALTGHLRTSRKLLVIGVPLALAIGLESSAFATGTNFAGHLGAVPLAAFGVALNVIALVYMLAIGLSTATAVRVGNAIGRGDPSGMRRAGWVGTALALALMFIVAILLALGAPAFAALYSAAPAVLALAVPALGIVAWLVIVDGVQGVLMGALRGAADVVVPAAIYAFCFWGLAVPLAWYFGLQAGYGVPGLLWSLFAGLLAAALLLGSRFQAISRRAIRPV